MSLVNTTTAGQQVVQAIGALAGGGYTVAWLSTDAHSDSTLRIQRYDAAGARQGAETLIPFDPDAAGASDPAVAVLSDGSVVVAYAATRQVSAAEPWIVSSGIYTQRFDASGAAIGGETAVTAIAQNLLGARATTSVADPVIVTWEDGRFMVGWSVVEQSTYGTLADLAAQRYDSAGQAAGDALSLGSNDIGLLSFGLDAIDDGGFLASTFHRDQGSLQVSYTIGDSLQREGDLKLLHDGEGFGPPAGSILLPLGGGGYVLWMASGDGASMQMIDSSGAAAGAPVTNGAMPSQALAMDDGGFVMFWTAGDPGVASGQQDLMGRRFDSAGRAASDEFRIDTDGAAPVITTTADGGLALAWTAVGAGGDADVHTQSFAGSTGMGAQRGEALVDTVFIDASLSGVQAWSFVDGVLSVTTAAGTQVLADKDRVQLQDALFALDTQAPVAGGPGGHAWQAAALYRAGFDSLPGQAELSQWIAQADQSDNMAALAQAMIDHYAPGISSSELVAHLYMNLVNAAPTAETVQGFVAQIGAGLPFANQGELLAYAAGLPLNTDAMAGFMGSIQQLDPDWF